MVGQTSLSSLAIVILAAFLTPILLEKLRLSLLPVVVAEIIVGLIIGKTGFNLIETGPWINILSSLGFIFLMFLSGVEIDFTVFANTNKKKLPNGKLEPNRFLLALCIFALILGISFLLSWGLVLAGLVKNAFYMTLVISTISLGVVVPTLKETEIIKTGIGQTILIITVVADLVTMILLAVFVSLHQKGSSMWLLIILLGAGIVLYLIGKVFRHQTFFEALSRGTVQIGTRAVFTLILLLVGLSEQVGTENILGAFIAGVVVSLLSPNKEMVKQLDSFGYGFLIPIFFVMVGVDLDVRAIIHQPTLLILIPLLLLTLVISKIIPTLVLLRWYDMRTTLGSGFLLTSTLSLVVAAAKVGEKIHVVSRTTSSSLILLAVITCIITPILYRKIFPFHTVEADRKRVSIFGVNQLTLPLSIELDSKQYEVIIYHKNPEVTGISQNEEIQIKVIPDYRLESLDKEDIFNSDIIVAATKDENDNERLAELARQRDVKHIIARVESPDLTEKLKEWGIHVVSSFFSTKVMVRAMVESPDIAGLLSTKEEGLHQVEFRNPEFDNQLLSKLPIPTDAIFVRVFRGPEAIVPHGDTKLQLGDRIIVTGSPASIAKLRESFS